MSATSISSERIYATIIIVMVLSMGTDLSAEETTTYFSSGTWDVGFGLGFQYADEAGAMDIGLEASYFVLDGLAPGAWVLGHIGFGNEPSAALVDAMVTYYFLRDGFLLPHASVLAGKAFYEDDMSAWNYGAGVGVTLALMRHIGLTVRVHLIRFDFPGSYHDFTSTMGGFSIVYMP